MGIFKTIFIFCSSILLFLINNSALAQGNRNHSIHYNVHKVASVAIKGGPPVSLSLIAPTEAGNSMTSTSNSNLWLNYSSITASGATNSVYVKSSINLPGIALKVIAAADVGHGGGAVGTPSSILTLSTTDQVIVSSIGSGYTGNGNNKGHNLTYSISVANYSLIKYTNSPISVTVTYTITNN